MTSSTRPPNRATARSEEKEEEEEAAKEDTGIGRQASLAQIQSFRRAQVPSARCLVAFLPTHTPVKDRALMR
ncbi:MAG: hypothetical protein AAGK05_17440 [Pseudomonadota bacterium]